VTRTTYALFALLATAMVLAIAGCGSSGGSESSESTSAGRTYGSPNPGSSEKEGEETPTSAEGGSAAVVSVGTAKDVGQVLVDSKGMTLYYFEKDGKGTGKSKCSGACAEAWPPQLTSGEATAMTGVQSSMLGTIMRSDGTEQVTYAGRPLYTFVEDKQPGEDNGTDSKAFGASWYPLHPNGQKAGH
jgi:predicted lipoprotein with Yx(FWY)xxD motif